MPGWHHGPRPLLAAVALPRWISRWYHLARGGSRRLSMSVSSLLSRRGCPPAAIVLLLVAALIGGGLEIRPVPAGGCSIATDDHAPDPQPREESSDGSVEDDERESTNHAVLGSAMPLNGPAPRGRRLCDCSARLAAAIRLGASPIRGPPSLA